MFLNGPVLLDGRFNAVQKTAELDARSSNDIHRYSLVWTEWRKVSERLLYVVEVVVGKRLLENTKQSLARHHCRPGEMPAWENRRS
jgi:hypothetical protein